MFTWMDLLVRTFMIISHTLDSQEKSNILGIFIYGTLSHLPMYT